MITCAVSSSVVSNLAAAALEATINVEVIHDDTRFHFTIIDMLSAEYGQMLDIKNNTSVGVEYSSIGKIYNHTHCYAGILRVWINGESCFVHVTA